MCAIFGPALERAAGKVRHVLQGATLDRPSRPHACSTSVTPQQIGASIRDFIDRTVLRGQGADVTTSMPLFELGILDSFALFTVLAFIEERFGVTLPLESVSADEFRDIDSIAGLVHARQSVEAG